jgi:hypothetical protein
MANKTQRTRRCCAVLALCATATFNLHADQVVMQNGDRYNGKVVSVSATNVVLQSDVLGVVNLARGKVANVALTSNAATNSVPPLLSPLAPDSGKTSARTNAAPEL